MPNLALVPVLLASSALAPPQAEQCLNESGDLLPAGTVPFGYGTSVALSGGRALVGATRDDVGAQDTGSAFLFELQGTAWVQIAKLTASDAAASDQLGSAVALSGGRALVAAITDDSGAFEGGSAYVFEEQGTSWVETAELLPSDPAQAQSFGASVALQGSLAVVGAERDDDGGFDAGAVYVFELQGTSWVETAKLVASDAVGGERLGQSVTLDGDVLVAGAPGRDDVPPDSGAAYVFEQQGSQWVETAKLTASDIAAGAFYGTAVSVSGSTLLVGTFVAETVYVVEKQGTSWVETGTLEPHDAAFGDRFGSELVLRDDTALIGAESDDGLAGSAYRFERQGSVWIEGAKFTSSLGQAQADKQVLAMGRSVALDGPLGLVGANRHAYEVPGAGVYCPPILGFPSSIELVDGGAHELSLYGGLDDALGLYLVLGTNAGTSPGIPLPPSNLVLPLNFSGYFLDTLLNPNAFVAGSLGFFDVSGIATATLTVPAGLHPSLGGTVFHHAYVVLDPVTLAATSVSDAVPVLLEPYPPQPAPCVLDEDATLATSDPASTTKFGDSVSYAAGRALVADAGVKLSALVTPGAAYVFERQGVQWVETAKLLPSDLTHQAWFGAQVELSDDVALVQAPYKGANGACYVFDRQGTAWVETDVLVHAAGAFDPFGRLALSDDTFVSGNQLDDAIYVFERQGTSWVETASFAGSDTAPGDRFGASVDLRGDRLAVGATRSGTAGAAYVFERQGTSWAELAKLVPASGLGFGSFGGVVSIDAGTVLVTDPSSTASGGTSSGAVLVFEEQGTGWVETATLVEPAPQSGRDFGADHALEGTRLLIGSDRPAVGSASLGTVYLYEDQGSGWTPVLQLQDPDADELGRSVHLDGDLATSHLGVFSGLVAGCQALVAKPPAISVAGGGAQGLTLEGGLQRALYPYFLVGTTAGTSPGLPLPGSPFVLPLNFSPYLQTTIALPNVVIANSLGNLDPYGEAEATLTLPAGLPAALIGLQWHHAYVVYQPGTTVVDLVSNPAPLTFVP